MASPKKTTEPTGQLTIAELAAVLAQALETGYQGVRSGRVQNLPDARAIRWYQTLGILDRPASFRGRTALYTRRHVLQLAAVKKLQAAGFPLAEIQRGLAGKTDRELAGAAGLTVARVEQLVAEAVAQRAADASARLAAAAKPMVRASTAFWKARPTRTTAAPSPAAATLQSQGVGQSVGLIWNGRALSAAEAEKLARLARPLVDYLVSQGAIAVTEPATPVPPEPARSHPEARS